MTYEKIFEEFKSIVKDADVSSINERLVYQFTITGEGEGKFYLEIDGGELKIAPYDYVDCDAEFVADGDTLLKIMQGKTDAALAFTLGKLKVHKSIEKALRLKDIASTVKKAAKAAPKAAKPAAAKKTTTAAKKAAPKAAAKTTATAKKAAPKAKK